MPMPTIITSENVLDIINHLKTKPTDVSLDDAEAAIDGRLLEPRKKNRRDREVPVRGMR